MNTSRQSENIIRSVLNLQKKDCATWRW